MDIVHQSFCVGCSNYDPKNFRCSIDCIRCPRITDDFIECFKMFNKVYQKGFEDGKKYANNSLDTVRNDLIALANKIK